MAEDAWSRLGRELRDLERDLGPDEAHRLWNDRRARSSRSRTPISTPRAALAGGEFGAPGHKHLPPEPGEDEILERDRDVRRERPWLR
jgi:hypothetical protein